MTPEQEQHRRDSRNIFCVDLFGEEVYNQIHTNQEIVVHNDQINHHPAYVDEFDASSTFLLVPIFLKQKFVGGLAIVKRGEENSFSTEDRQLTKAVVAQATLLIECILCLQEQTKTKTKIHVLQEVNRLSTEFFTLASHELRSH